MYKLLLILKYLRRRVIAWFALLAVMLCTTMVLVVISVMGGWLDMFENSARGLTGDIIIRSDGLSGFPRYEEVMETIRNDPEAHVAAATPSLHTFGVVNIANRKTDAVQVIGYKLDEIGQVNQFPESLYWQHQKYLDEGKQPPPGPPTWDRRSNIFRQKLAELPEGIKLKNPQAGTLTLGDATLEADLKYDVADGDLVLRGRLSPDDEKKLAELSSEKAWKSAVRQLASQSNWPGMIPSAGVLDIHKDHEGKIEGRDPWKYDLWVKLSVVGIGPQQQLDLQGNKSERQYWIADDSRTGMWQYDMKTVYVPFDVLQRDLGMDAKATTRLEPVFFSDAGVPARMLGKAGKDGKYSLYKGRSQEPEQTVDLKAGQEVGFRKGENGHVVAVAGDQTFDLGDAPADADWRYQQPDTIPARTTEIQVRLKPGADTHAARDRIEKDVQAIVDRHPGDFGLGDEPRVETWDQASALFINAIKNEELLVVFLFGIISIVAIFLIFCIFYMIVAEKTKDIGIIKSVGATSSGIAGIFLGYGLAIGVLGAGIGLLVSYLLVHFINQIHTWLGKALHVQIWNPEVYAFDKIPNQMKPVATAVIVSVAVLFSVIGALIPAIRASRLHPVEALRWE